MITDSYVSKMLWWEDCWENDDDDEDEDDEEEKNMSKFSIKTCATVNIPESFRKDLLELCVMAEEDYRLDFCNIIDTIMEAPLHEDKWCNHDSSIVINFYKDEK